MRNEAGAKLGIVMSALGIVLGAWFSARGTLSGVQSGANTAAEAGVFIGVLACVVGVSTAFLATLYRRLTTTSDRS